KARGCYCGGSISLPSGATPLRIILSGNNPKEAAMGGAGATLPQWFDSQTLLTAAGSTTVVITVTAVVQRSLPTLPARWFAFALSLLIALLAISVQGLAWTWVSVFVALVNGVMTYAAAVGVNTVATAAAPSGLAAAPSAARSYRWWS